MNNVNNLPWWRHFITELSVFMESMYSTTMTGRRSGSCWNAGSECWYTHQSSHVAVVHSLLHMQYFKYRLFVQVDAVNLRQRSDLSTFSDSLSHLTPVNEAIYVEEFTTCFELVYAWLVMAHIFNVIHLPVLWHTPFEHLFYIQSKHCIAIQLFFVNIYNW